MQYFVTPSAILDVWWAQNCCCCRTAEVAEEIWAQTFKYLADNKVLFEGMLLKPSMVTPGADSGKKVGTTITMTFGCAVQSYVVNCHN